MSCVCARSLWDARPCKQHVLAPSLISADGRCCQHMLESGRHEHEYRLKSRVHLRRPCFPRTRTHAGSNTHNENAQTAAWHARVQATAAHCGPKIGATADKLSTSWMHTQQVHLFTQCKHDTSTYQQPCARQRQCKRRKCVMDMAAASGVRVS
jgi:hypothetical protein